MTQALPPFFAQFTPQQLQAQYAKNAIGLRRMQAKAEQTGRKVNGFTADQLRKHADLFEAKARGEG